MLRFEHAPRLILRLYFILILTVVVMAFTTGYLALRIQGAEFTSSIDSKEIVALKEEFSKKVLPQLEVDFRALYYLKDHFQLIDPIYTFAHEGPTLAPTTPWSEANCFGPLITRLTTLGSEKQWLWEEYRCKRISRLPYDYFIKPPYMHPSGFSYVLLAIKTQKRVFLDPRWIRANVPLFHVTELNQVRDLIGDLDGPYALLADFSRSALRAVVEGESAVLSEGFVLFRSYPRNSTLGLKYDVHSRKHFDDFLRSTPYVVSEYGGSCPFRDGQMCWGYTEKHLFKLASNSIFLVFLISLGIVSLSLGAIFLKLRGDRREGAKKKLALQVLTHEFRTPVTSLMLQIERLNRDYEKMSPEMQEAFIRMSGDVFRLQRLSENSRKYLSPDKDMKLIAFEYKNLDSVNRFFYTQCETYADRLELNFLSEDRKARLDPYWVGICVKNIVENALSHGGPPFKLTLQSEGPHLICEVVDHGQMEFDSLDRISTEFVRSEKSRGMGLGLNIVRKVIEEMGGELSLSTHPTKFKMVIKDVLL